MIIKDVLLVRLGLGLFEHPGPIKFDQFLLNPDFKILIMFECSKWKENMVLLSLYNEHWQPKTKISVKKSLSLSLSPWPSYTVLRY